MKRFPALCALLCALSLSSAAHAADFTVSKTADTNDGVCDADCSLREAITAANAASSDDAIIFSPTAFAAPRKTIALSSDGLTINGAGALSITAPVAGVTITGGPQLRVFTIISGPVRMSGLTISGGDTTGHAGGGLFVQNALTLDRCTVADNNSALGAGIFVNMGENSSNTLTLRNCTLSGNRATLRGGGIYIQFGRAVIESSTLTRNVSSLSNGLGAAIAARSGDASVALLNTIAAGNEGTDLDLDGGTVNLFESGGSNLIGDGNATGVFVNTGDQIIGDTAPGLASLGDNGGPTPTNALTADSPAINKGGANAPERDQRGYARVGNPDIGAFEFDGFMLLAPHNDSLSPSGTVSDPVGKARTFRATYSDPNGYRDIRYTYLQVKTGSKGVLRVAYDLPNNKLYILGDNGQYQGGVKPGSNTILRSSQGAIACKYTKASALNATTMQVDWVIAGGTPLIGSQPVLLYVTDKGGLSDGFDQGATWTIASN